MTRYERIERLMYGPAALNREQAESMVADQDRYERNAALGAFVRELWGSAERPNLPPIVVVHCVRDFIAAQEQP